MPILTRRFIAPKSLMDCLTTLLSHQRMPDGGGFGLWVEIHEVTKEAHYTADCRLLFGNSSFRPIAWYTVTLQRETDDTTQVSVVMTDFNFTIAAGFGFVSIIGILFVLFGGTMQTSGTLILTAVFAGFGIFGYFLTRAQYADACKLPDAMQGWLSEP